MAQVFVVVLMFTALIGVMWVQDCDSAIQLLQLQCPFYKNTTCKPCHRACAQDSDCVIKTGAGSMCCPYECGSTHCVPEKNLCSSQVYNPCAPLAYYTLCFNSTACGKSGSCCSVGCGAAQCRANVKAGSCPAASTASPQICSFTSTTQCSSDTNCFGQQKCCYSYCHGMTCTNPA